MTGIGALFPIYQHLFAPPSPFTLTAPGTSWGTNGTMPTSDRSSIAAVNRPARTHSEQEVEKSTHDQINEQEHDLPSEVKIIQPIFRSSSQDHDALLHQERLRELGFVSAHNAKTRGLGERGKVPKEP
jgi:hypothetical protein